MKLFSLKLVAIIAVFTAHAPGKLDVQAANTKYYWQPRFTIKKRLPVTRSESDAITSLTIEQDDMLQLTAVTAGYMINAEEELNEVLEICLFKVEETKTKPFSYFVNRLIELIKKYWHAFKTKFSTEHELKQLVEELDAIKDSKNIMAVGKILVKYKKLLPPHSQIHKTGIFTLKGLLSSRLSVVGDDSHE